MTKTNQLLLALFAGVIGAPLRTMADGLGAGQTGVPAAIALPVEGKMPALRGANEWLNSPPLRRAELQGKVVLVQFWTYSCINWLRTLPYVRAWAEKYRDQGLVVIGVHTPEFGFEHDIEKIRHATQDRGINYPVAVDSDRAIWQAFENNAWPALYFVDAQGRIRHHHLGEGEYGRSERIIQQLLAESGRGGTGHELVSVEGRGVEASADWTNLRSGEKYLGYERTDNFTSPGGGSFDEARRYVVPMHLRLNQWALAGEWTIAHEAVILNRANGRIAYRFHARDLHLVMGAAKDKMPVRFRVLLDGQPPGAAHGADVDESGNGALREHRLYQLIRQSGPVTDRQFEIEFLESGAEAFSFTFG